MRSSVPFVLSRYEISFLFHTLVGNFDLFSALPLGRYGISPNLTIRTSDRISHVSDLLMIYLKRWQINVLTYYRLRGPVIMLTAGVPNPIACVTHPTGPQCDPSIASAFRALRDPARGCFVGCSTSAYLLRWLNCARIRLPRALWILGERCLLMQASTSPAARWTPVTLVCLSCGVRRLRYGARSQHNARPRLLKMA